MISHTRLKLVVIALTWILTGAAVAQDSGLKRTIIGREDVGDGYETVVGTAEIAPALSIGRHSHPGVELGYIAEGEVELLIEGEPAKHLKKGDSYRIERGKTHDVRNGGPAIAKAVAVWIVEKGKPLAQPVK